MVETGIRNPYHFVSHDEEIMFFGKNSDVLELFSGKDFSHRVVRRIDNNHFSPRRDRTTGNVVSRQAGRYYG